MTKPGKTDILTDSQRSALMSKIRGKNTKPEIALRKALFALGLRYRLHSKGVFGRPDIVFPRLRAAVFLNGCFWHGHQRCGLFKWPKQNAPRWRSKIQRNRARDAEVKRALQQQGWRTMTVWECAVRKAPADRFAQVALQVKRWLEAPMARTHSEISARAPAPLTEARGS